ncbi:MAG TPA: ABC transporter permease [Bryobacteraceae bacterium]|nr:ABC transporter permease [Bryobacteraceae bacterium]
MLSDVLYRVRSLFARGRVEDELDEELRFHYENAVARGVREGLTQDEALRRARILVGGIDQLKEECRDARGVRFVEILIQDLRYAVRTLCQKPVFAGFAILTLALGIGANTAIFSVVNAVLLRSLPFPEPARLVRIRFSNPGLGLHGVLYSVPELQDLRSRAGVFESVTGICRGSVNMTGGVQPERLEVVLASANYFTLLGVAPQIGRLFGRDDEVPGIGPSAVISDSLWRRDFSGDPNVLGRTIRIDGEAYRIAGVLPPAFRYPSRSGRISPHDVDVWLAYGFMAPSDPKPTRSTRAFPGVIGRLKRGITFAQAQARLTAMAAEIRREFPADYPPQARWTIEIVPMQDDLVGDVRPMLLVLLGAVMLVVLMVSLNIANLLLARASVRQREMALRSALGASRPRILAQMLTESMLLSSIGGIVGIAAAFVGLRFLLQLIPPGTPRLTEVDLDGRVLLFAVLASVLTGLIFGLAPALHAMRSNLFPGIRENSRGCGASAKTGRFRDLLVISELALALVLMVGAGLLLGTLRSLLDENPGFNPTQLVTANVNLPYPGDPAKDPYHTLGRQIAFYRELSRRINSIPGVTLAGFASQLPNSDFGFRFPLAIEDRPANGDAELRARDIPINPDYFEVMQIPLVRGRNFSNADEGGKQRVAIVDESTARRYWPDRDALGRRIRMGQGPWMTIVGIVKDVKQDGLDAVGFPHVYVPMYQDFDVSQGYIFRDFVIAARTSLPVSTLEPEIRRQVSSLDPDLPVYDVASMNHLLDRSLASRRLAAQMVGGFALVALLLASIGIYGLLAFMVGQRSREIGVRVALGASRADVMKLIVGKGVILAGIGIPAGVLAASAAASMMGSVLYGVRSHDPIVFLAATVLLFVVTLLASYLPARRATRVDPNTALREA